VDDNDPIIGKRIGNCTVQRKLGQGGMGAVYLAHHPGLNKAVAIKVLPGDLASNPEFKERFFRERHRSRKSVLARRAARRLSQANQRVSKSQFTKPRRWDTQATRVSCDRR
jgi:serine/threonine protein kinase